MVIKKVTLISLLLGILVLTATVGHFLPPTGILVIPLVIILMTALIMLTDYDLPILTKSTISYLFIGLNDIGIKLFAGGRHDSEGLGWIHMLLFIGLVPCFIILIIGVLRDGRSAVISKILSVFIFALLICIHLELFNTVGLGIHIKSR